MSRVYARYDDQPNGSCCWTFHSNDKSLKVDVHLTAEVSINLHGEIDDTNQIVFGYPAILAMADLHEYFFRRGRLLMVQSYTEAEEDLPYRQYRAGVEIAV